jgi:hypothetical protein
MYFVLKAVCLGIYALAIAGWTGLLPSGLAGSLQTIALVMLAVHAVELAVMFKHVKRYPGPLAISIVLAMLFGLLHWKPLADAAKKG